MLWFASASSSLYTVCVLIGQRCFAATMNHEEFRRVVLMVQLDRVDDVVNPRYFT